MITAIIIDDEQDAIESLTWEINMFCKDIKIVDSFTNPEEAISAVNYLKPDCVFLDIEMPKIDGFQLLSHLKYRDFDLVITTAYDNYALKAFKENAIDYLLKPIDNDDLIQVVEKIKKNKLNKQLGFSVKDLLPTIEKKNKKIAIPLSGKVVFLNIEEVVYCKSDGNYTTLFLLDGTSYLYSKKIKDVYELLNTEDIVRVHQSYLVNMNFVKEYVKNEGYYLILENTKTIPVSKPNRMVILEAMQNL
ncbi:LytR/AlgR family response regulator transcription factor [Polaribacter sp. R77954]|uniref:LytR/AlgR family response regulator transcription factor n=1 Tax=Polaribacter sp. R77954 TaxID=3093870 RepID=UPI0037CC8699